MHLQSSSVLLSLALLSCGSESRRAPTADAAPPDAAPLQLFDVDIDVLYDGAAKGALIVGAFRNDPPAGPPLALQMVSVPVFPVSVQLRGLEAGTYFLTAMLDRPPESPTIPGPEDLLATEPANLGPNGVDSLTLAIEDDPS